MFSVSKTLYLERAIAPIMSKEKLEFRIPSVFFIAASVVILAGIMYSSVIVTQFLMAVFIAIVSAKPVGFLRKLGMSNGIAVIVVLLFIVLFSLSLGGLLGTSVANFTSNLDVYNSKVIGTVKSILGYFNSKGIRVSSGMLLNTIDPGLVMNFTARILNSMGVIMGNWVMILLIVGFILAEADSFPLKLSAILNRPQHSIHQISEVVDQINHYLGIKTITSLMTGVIIAVSLWILGVDFPIVWGLIAFLFNYIPNIGSIIAAVPAMFMALVSLGLFGLLWTAVIFLVVNMVIGNILEPKIMGSGLGISTLVVLLSLIFWGWILGTAGMFLSIPLTLVAKIAFESNPSTRWIAIILDSEEDFPSKK